MPMAVLIFLALTLLPGCSKQPDAAARPRPATTTSASNPAPDPAALEPLLAQLTQAVRRYGMERQRAPQSLDELVQAGYLRQLPAPPPGKRFVIDAKLEVKLAD